MVHEKTEPNLALAPGEIWWCEGVGREAPHSEAQAARGDTVLAKTKSGLVVVVQDDAKSRDLDSATVCPMTEDEHNLAPYRMPVEASQANGLGKRSRLMLDQVTTVKRGRLKERIGAIDDDTLNRVYYQMLAFMVPDASVLRWRRTQALMSLRPGERLPQRENAPEDAYREVWTVQDDDDDYARSKPRPAVVVQNMTKSGGVDSVTVCLFTTHEGEAFYRIPVVASEVNGLDKHSRLMVDKVTTIERGRRKERIGVLGEDTMKEFYLAMLDFMIPEESTFLSTFFQE